MQQDIPIWRFVTRGLVKPGRVLTGLLFLLWLLIGPPALDSQKSTTPQSCLPAANRFRGYSFIHPLLIDPRAPGAAYVLDFEKVYQRFGRQDQMQADENVAEWRERYCDIPLAEDIRDVVYRYSDGDLLQMSTMITAKGIPMDPYMRQNSFARYLVRNRCLETIDYLLFAKECEPWVVRRNPWEDKARAQQLLLSMDDLIQRGLEYFKNTKSDYIRLRYAYQIVRLAHYSRQYERTLELFDYLMPKINHDPSVIEYWILGHKAGALQQLGRNVEAAYLYARVFLNAPGKRESAYRSFRINSDEEWKQALLLCADDRERATLYMMRALARDAKPLEEMAAIYELDPGSEYLDVLLMREMRRLERDLLGLEFNDRREQNRRFAGIPRADASQRVIDLQAFVRRLNAERQVLHPALWLIAQGYLETLAGDYYAAGKTFDRARENTNDKLLLDQIDAFDLARRISSIYQATPEVEDFIAETRLDNKLYTRYPDFPDFLQDKMRWVYQRQSQPGKAFLIAYPFRDLRLNPQENLIDDLLAMSQKEDLNRLERELLRKTEKASIQNDLIDLKATMLFGQGNLAAALEEYKKMDRTAWDSYGQYNPFYSRFADCVNCPVRGDTSTMLNKGEILEKMLDLEYKAQASRTAGADYLYQLGMAWYNMSYFGHSWQVLDNFRSGVSLKRQKSADDPDVVLDNRFALGNREHFDLSRALNYFDMVQNITVDPELNAKATFMAAKCEQNMYFLGRAPRTYQYFEKFKRQHSQTRIYALIVQECKYFKAYAAK